MSRAKFIHWKPVPLLVTALIALVVPLFSMMPADAAASYKAVDANTIDASGISTECNNVVLTNSNGTFTGTCTVQTVCSARFAGGCNPNKYTYTITNVKASGSNFTGTISGPGVSGTVTISGNGQKKLGNATAGSAPASSSSGSSSTQEDQTALNCGGGVITWIICPVINMLVDATNWLDSFIMNTLNIDVICIFDTNTSQCNTGGGNAATGYYTAWNQFRIIATAILIIGGLIMVTSQALGFEMLDAYTVRKVLPRLIIAVIGISLSWWIMRFVVLFFDTLGFDIRNLMYTPFKNLGGTLSVTGGLMTSLVTAGIIFTYGFASLAFIGTALLAAFVGFLILVIRQIAVVMLIIMAPVAIACYILPNTQKVWKLWYDNFLGLMLMFPIISGLIAAGHIFAAVALKPNGPNGNTGGLVAQATAIVAYFAPYFLLPMAARMATGVIGNLAGFVNDRHKGAFAKLAGVRQQTAANRHQRRMNEQTWFSNTRAGRAYQRVGNMQHDGLSMTKGGRERYEAYHTKHRLGLAAKALEEDGGFTSGDTLANAIASQKGMTRDRFVADYAAAAMKNGASNTEAMEQAQMALGRMQASYGARMGTNAMRTAALKALGADNGAWDEGTQLESQQAAYGAVGQAVADGIMSASDAAGILKSNRARVDRSGNSWGDTIGTVQKVAAEYKRGGNGASVLSQVDANTGKTLAAKLADNVLNDTNARETVSTAHNRAVKLLAPEYARRFNEAFATGDKHKIADAAADIMSVHDTLGHESPLKQKAFADAVFGAGVKTTDANGKEKWTTVRAVMEDYRTEAPGSHGEQRVLERRREYGSRRDEDMANSTRPPQDEG